MSEREELQNRIVAWLNDRRDRFSAPYGILPDLQRLKRGAVRTVTFGVARYLDATLFIWSPTNLVIQTNRGGRSFTSEAELYQAFEDHPFGGL